jgi:hypothetical protein
MTDLGFFSVSDASLAIQTCRRLNSSPVMQSNFVDVLLKRYPRFTDAGGSNLMFFKLVDDMLGNTALARRCDSDGVLLDPSSVAVSVQAEWNRPLGVKADYFGLFYKRSGGWTFLQGPCLDNSCDLEDSNINLDSPPEGAVNEEYEHTIIATNLAGNMTITGLPPGLTFNGSTGVISGTPTLQGIFTVIVSGTSAENECPITRAFNLVINPCDFVDAFIDLDDPPNGEVDTLYEHTIFWDDLEEPPVVTGLPLGVSFDPDTGLISGTPTEEGAWIVTVQGITIPNGCPIVVQFIFRVGPCDVGDAFLVVAIGISNFLEIGTPFFLQVFGNNIEQSIELEKVEVCCPPYSNTCFGDGVSLPSGLTYDPATGIIFDAPDDPNDCLNNCTYRLTFKAISIPNECVMRTTFDLYFLCDCPDPDEIECEDAWVGYISCATTTLPQGPGFPYTARLSEFNATIDSVSGLPAPLVLDRVSFGDEPWITGDDAEIAPGTYNIRICGTIQSGDNQGCQVCKNLSLTITL